MQEGYTFTENEKNKVLILPKFFYKEVPQKDGPPLQVEYVELTALGSTSNVIHKVTDQHRREYKRLYDAWKEGNTPPEIGTSIDAVSTLTKEQKERAKLIGINSAEIAAAYPDGSLHKLGMDGREIQQKCQRFLEHGKNAQLMEQLVEKNGKLSEEVALYKEQLKTLNDRFLALEKQLSKKTKE